MRERRDAIRVTALVRRHEGLLRGLDVCWHQVRVIDIGRHALAVVRAGALFGLLHRTTAFGRSVHDVQTKIERPVFVVGIFSAESSHVSPVQIDQNANGNEDGHPGPQHDGQD